MSRPVRILHLLGNFGFGGAEAGVVRLCRSLESEKLKHLVCSVSPDTRMKARLSGEIPVYSLNIDGRCYSAWWGLYKLVKRHKVDIVHVNNLAPWTDAVLACRLAGVKCISTFHGVETENLKVPFIRKRMWHIAAAGTKRMTAVAESAAKLFSALTGIPKRKVIVIPNGVDTEVFRPPTSLEEKAYTRRMIGLPEEGFLIGCVAALRPVKNHENLIKGFHLTVKSNEDLKIYLILIGEGPLKERLQAVSEEHNVSGRVVFMGLREDVPVVLRALDAFSLNSTTEGMSYSILEAMASGLPIVATAVGANEDLISDGEQGYLLPRNGDPQQVAKCFDRLLRLGTEIREMGLSSRGKIVERCSLESMIEAYRELYLTV